MVKGEMLLGHTRAWRLGHVVFRSWDGEKYRGTAKLDVREKDVL